MTWRLADSRSPTPARRRATAGTLSCGSAWNPLAALRESSAATALELLADLIHDSSGAAAPDRREPSAACIHRCTVLSPMVNKCNKRHEHGLSAVWNCCSKCGKCPVIRHLPVVAWHSQSRHASSRQRGDSLSFDVAAPRSDRSHHARNVRSVRFSRALSWFGPAGPNAQNAPNNAKRETRSRTAALPVELGFVVGVVGRLPTGYRCEVLAIIARTPNGREREFARPAERTFAARIHRRIVRSATGPLVRRRTPSHPASTAAPHAANSAGGVPLPVRMTKQAKDMPTKTQLHDARPTTCAVFVLPPAVEFPSSTAGGFSTTKGRPT